MNIVHSCAITLLLLTTVLSAQSGLDWRGHDVFPRYNGSGFAKDIHRNKVVRYGGWRGGILSNETWEWDGRHWRQMFPKHSPPALDAPILGFDTVSKRIILFGGIEETRSPQGGAKKINSKTWAWDGKDWTQLNPKNSPSARFSHRGGMVTDLKNKQLLMYGGLVPGGLFPLPLQDFWAWDGKDWKQLLSAAPPGRMLTFSLGYLGKTGQTILFGGQRLSSTFVMVDETWSWNGKTWKKLGYPSSSWIRPSPRSSFRMCESPTDGSLLLHGGVGWNPIKSVGLTYDDLWRFDGKKWKLLKASTGVTKDPESNVAEDLYRMGKEVQQFFSDKSGYGISDVRRWTGKKWELLERLPEEPLPFASLVYDEARHELLLLGGATPGAKPTLLQVYRLHAGRFQLVPVKTSPPYDGGHQHVFDPVSQTILFFEATSTNRATKVWSWNGNTWSILSYSGASPYVVNACYNPLSKTVLLSSYNSTWEWTGKGFRELGKHSAGPLHVRMAFDVKRKRMIGYGMERLTSAWTYETWEWIGRTWKKMKPLVKTPQAKGAFIRYFPEIGKVVLSGGARITRAGHSFDETWAYDGRTWSQLKVHPMPVRANGPAGTMDALIYDPGQGRLLALYHDIHVALRELSFRSLSLSAPLIRTGERTSFDIDLPKAAGQFFLLGLSLGRDPGIPLYHEKDIGTRLLPLALDTMLLWSFSGPILTQLDAKGQGSIPFAIPKIPNLPELDIWAAGLTLDPKQSFRIGATSNRAILQIVR